MIAVWKRELGAYFRTATGYVYLGVFLLAGGIFFVMHNLAKASGSTQTLFNNLMYLFLLVTPILTMRLLSEEKRNRTDQLLLGAPIACARVVAGKFLAAVAVFFIGMVATTSYALIIMRYGQAYWGALFANYLGFFLMGMCYIAMGVLASALTESQVTAAVVTFGFNIVLQFLQGIQGLITAPFLTPLSKLLGLLSLSARYQAFEAGVVSVSNVTYYLLFCLIALTLASLAFDRGRIRRVTVMRAALLLVAAVTLQLGIQGLDQRYGLNADLSQTQLTKLEDGTRQVLDGIDQPVDIYLLYRDGTNAQQRVFLEQLTNSYSQYSAQVQVQTLDPITQPGAVRQLTGRDEAVSEGTVIVSNPQSGAVKTITAQEMYTYKTNASGGYEPYAFNGQARITSAIMYVTHPQMPKVYFLSGHEELGLSHCTVLKEQLASQNYQVAQWTFGQEALEGEDTLIVIAPTLDLTDSEYAYLSNWLQSGGRMLYATDPSVDMGKLSNFTRLLDPYGLAFLPGYVIESETELSRYLNTQQVLVPVIDTTAQVCQALSAARLVLPQAAALDENRATYGLSRQALLKTSKSAFLKSPDSQTNVFTREDDDPTGEFVLAMSAVKADTGTRIVAIGNIYTLADTNYLSATNNLNFSAGAISWLVNQNTSVNLPAKVLSGAGLNVGNMATYWMLAALVVVGLPLFVLIVGFIIWQRRRHL